jgi:hypothetical protein
VKKNPLKRMWERASACLVVSPLAFLFGGVLVLNAIREDFDSAPRDWLVIALTLLGVGFFALGATTWGRALALTVRSRRGTVSD